MSVLGQYLAQQGFVVDDNPALGRLSTWQQVRWVMIHHYAGLEVATDAARQAQYLRRGGTYPPNAHLYVDVTGKVWVCSVERPGQHSPGRASHAGRGSYPGIATDRGNEVALGIEFQCNGSHALANHPEMYAVGIRLSAALVRYYNLPVDASRVIGHKEYAGAAQGKIDPRDDMANWRRQVAATLTGGGTPPPQPPPPPPTPSSPPYLPGVPMDKTPFPGADKFGPGKENDYILMLGSALCLTARYRAHYSSGPSRDWGPADQAACAHFQRDQGWTGEGADGIPGPQTWQRLGLS